ncbi:MAG: Thymidylate kinase [Candidatus Ozemobacter sibiricus]|uniref:Thymidylate kinase n=1 Tax=Candidatus Ozemobacter sibiricus TaxID=2268124 RepID=A0A367ZLZ9_9BACT|nr:MAG: Thymidylate kinase [Candidatus Ozemobacter sibiricus]
MPSRRESILPPPGQPLNRLQFEASPYFLPHAGNPIDWYPWSEEAFRKARSEDKPTFLSIGYSTCHWCHVMAHEVVAVLLRVTTEILKPSMDS